MDLRLDEQLLVGELLVPVPRLGADRLQQAHAIHVRRVGDPRLMLITSSR